ncbi:NAD(P)-binding protein [Streptomyces sp. NPDC007988]|uniref:phytoene desaturase family protein n=1 Tax=Streptomyces sp. NPDC007988 TaxID=3364802 RepID=UPI0036E696E9
MVIVGTGPNGLAAGVTMARAGLRVTLYEQARSIGGGLRGEALFDTDITHDICAAVHPMAVASPFLRAFDLAARGVEALVPDVSYAHPLDGGRAALAHRGLEATCAGLGPDGPRWRRLMEPLLEHSAGVVGMVLSPQRAVPGDLAAASAFARRALVHGTRLAAAGFRTEEARALLTGVAAHAVGPLPSLASGAVALLLGHLAHSGGWPVLRGGSARMAEALADDIRAHGGVFHTGRRITDLRELGSPKAVLLDLTPKGFARVAPGLPAGYRRRLARFRYGPGAAKADFLVNGPVPWADPAVNRAGTVHLGGTQAEMWRQETRTARGTATDEPFVLVVDPAVADPGRAVAGKRPVWAYAHVPNGDRRDAVELVRARIERYAPGFSDTVLAQRGISAHEYEDHNPNYVGGDIGAGAMTLVQSVLRPTARLDPYTTPLRGVYLCSASTPPGPGVHGMSGYLAARSALRREFGIRKAPPLGPESTPWRHQKEGPPPERLPPAGR